VTSTQTTLVPMDRDGAKPSDIYYTPGDAIRSLLDSDRAPLVELPMFEPAAGRGDIVNHMMANDYYFKLCVEIRAEEVVPLVASTRGYGKVMIGDFLTMPYGKAWLDMLEDVDPAFVTNPPFSLAAQFWLKCHAANPCYVAFLLRLNTLGSATWVDAWNLYPPTFIRSLIRRPSFTKTGKGTDAAEYAWVGFRRGDPPLDFKMV